MPRQIRRLPLERVVEVHIPASAPIRRGLRDDRCRSGPRRRSSNSLDSMLTRVRPKAVTLELQLVAPFSPSIWRSHIETRAPPAQAGHDGPPGSIR